MRVFLILTTAVIGLLVFFMANVAFAGESSGSWGSSDQWTMDSMPSPRDSNKFGSQSYVHANEIADNTRAHYEYSRASAAPETAIHVQVLVLAVIVSLIVAAVYLLRTEKRPEHVLRKLSSAET